MRKFKSKKIKKQIWAKESERENKERSYKVKKNEINKINKKEKVKIKIIKY